MIDAEEGWLTSKWRPRADRRPGPYIFHAALELTIELRFNGGTESHSWLALPGAPGGNILAS